jgi:raffinose/stachyose/melibiose transport system substrate-binding protein
VLGETIESPVAAATDNAESARQAVINDEESQFSDAVELILPIVIPKQE